MAGFGGAGVADDHPPRRLGRTPKEGERILPSTPRPDGTLRKSIRIRAGYTPPDEVPIYQPRGVRMKKTAEMELPPGYDPELDSKPKTKSAKRNERKKEKKIQAALAASDGKGKSLDAGDGQTLENHPNLSHVPSTQQAEPLESVTCEMSKLSVSSTSMAYTDHSESPNPGPPESSNVEPIPAVILDKRIRALRKKIRLAGMQEQGSDQAMKPEQMEKLEKLAAWRAELEILEKKRAASSIS